MEILSVQNEFQGQFGVIGSNKIKDWTRSLAPPRKNSQLNSISSNTSHNVSSPSKRLSESLSMQPNACDEITSATTNNEHGSEFLSFASTLRGDTPSNDLSLRLQDVLREAKSRHLACTEVLLPADLLHRVSREMLKVSENEPCGIRGCSVYVEFEDEPNNTRRIATLKVDPNTVSTFELYLTLKHDKSGWIYLLPQFLKNLARSSTIMISPEFTLTKNKLYNSFCE